MDRSSSCPSRGHIGAAVPSAARAVPIRRPVVSGVARLLSVGALVLAAGAPRLASADEPAFAGASDASAAAHHTLHRQPVRCDAAIGAEAFARTELYFGLSSPAGVIGEAAFKAFVDQNITPRFPDGLTLLSGSGQFRDASGTTIVEGSKLLILLYPLGDPSANARIEAIRSDYRTQFQQQSVLRTDDASCVSF